jgi:DNA-binding NarL/FixJ family response regulator
MRVLLYDHADTVIGWTTEVLREDPDIVIVGPAQDRVIVYNLLRGRRIDVAVVGMKQCCEFLDVYNSIYWRHPPVLKKMCLGSFATEATVDWALQLGYDDVIDSTDPRDDIRRQIRDLHEGRRQVTDLSGPESDTDDPHTLSVQLHDVIDREIVRLISRGYADREIAQWVYLSPQTVRNRVSRLLERSGTRNRTQLAVLFVRGQVTWITDTDGLDRTA